MSVESLAQVLLEAGILDVTSVESKASRARTARQLLEDLIAAGDATETSLVNQLARALSVPRYDPRDRQPEPAALQILDLQKAEQLGVLPVAVRGGGALLWVALCDPTDEELLADVSRRTGRRVKACVIGPRELARAIEQARAASQKPAAAPTPQPLAAAYPPYPPPGATMAGYAPPPYGYAYAQPPLVSPTPMPRAMPTPMPGPVVVPSRAPELQKLEEELAQAKQVVRVITQLLVERGLIDGEELKVRLRAERDKR